MHYSDYTLKPISRALIQMRPVRVDIRTSIGRALRDEQTPSRRNFALGTQAAPQSSGGAGGSGGGAAK
eukprot:564754-Prorocentrum_minimum.AAC.1